MASRQTVNPVYRSGAMTTLLNLLQTDAGDLFLDTPKVKLFTGALVPTPATPLGDFTAAVATFSGYNFVAGPVTAAVVAPGSNSRALYMPANFVATSVDPFVGNTITGYMVELASGWVMAERFPPGQEVQIAGPFDFLDLAVYLGFPLSFSY